MATYHARLILRETVHGPLYDYLESNVKSVFDWEVFIQYDDGMSKVGSLEANYWAEVKTGVSERDTLSHMKQHLQSSTNRIPSTFEYIDVEKEQAKERLEYLRGEIWAERISYSEIAELQALADYIADGDVELLQWAGVPEQAEEEGNNA